MPSAKKFLKTIFHLFYHSTMKTTQQVREKQAVYGYAALDNKELAILSEIKNFENYETTDQFKAMQQLVARGSWQPERKITCSRDAYNAIPELQNLDHEEFWILYLNRQNKIISRKRLAVGGVAGCVVDPKIIAKSCFEQPRIVSNVIVAHNHPSGNLQPSSADIEISKKIKQGLNLFDINLFDSIIVGHHQEYYSLSDEGII
jgi:DNA repair protein RadC